MVLLLIACSTAEVDEGAIEETISDSDSTITTQSSNNDGTADSTTTSVVENYNFDNEKMSPFTGIELPGVILKLSLNPNSNGSPTKLKRPHIYLIYEID